MTKLKIKRKTLNRMQSICSNDLISSVFEAFGLEDIIIDDLNQEQDTWEISEFIDSESCPLVDKLKVLYTFEKLYGHIEFDGKETCYNVLTAILGNKIEFHDVRRRWEHMEQNHDCPSFSLGDIIIPDIYPSYNPLMIAPNCWVIEKLTKEGRVQLAGQFMTKEACFSHIEELIRDEIDI